MMGTDHEHPLGLPQGSVRSIIALILTCTVPVLAFMWAFGKPLAGK